MDTPLDNPDMEIFTDGSSFVWDGMRKAGYAVVAVEQVLEAKSLPQGTSALLAELVALTQALELSKGQRMGLIIYVSLLLLTPKILSLPFAPQDNAFLSWAHSYAAFHNRSNCWVCGALPSSSVEGFQRWTSPLQGKDFLQICEYLRQQSHAMPLIHLMTFTNPKMDWCKTLRFDVTFNFDSECCVFAVCSLHL